LRNQRRKAAFFREGSPAARDLLAKDYSAGHIPGAISIPFDELAARLAELPADQEIVAYFQGIYCVLAPWCVYRSLA
jgi:rhodanese-related sulfurtransferase